MSKHATRRQTRQKRQQETARGRETARRQTSTPRSYHSTQPVSLWTIGFVVLALVGLIAFVFFSRQNSNPAYAAVDKITCDAGEHSDVHIHAHLTLYLNGQKTPLPAGIGIASDDSCLYWLHTHNTDGIIHIEAPGGRSFTLKNFLDIWSAHFASLGYPSQLNHTAGWQVYVNGKPFAGDFRTIPLQAHTLITLAYHSPGIHPDTSFPWNGL
jgi:hypothetical protein